jgi:aldehyde:ferredoxin oxidoreductase
MSAVGKDNAGARAYKSMGTVMLVDIMNEAGGFPTRYWNKGKSEHRESFNASALLDRTNIISHSCPKCFMACGKMATIKEGRHKGLKIEGPEYETIFAFGGLCEINGIEEIIYLNDMCDRLGMDTISAGNLAAFTIEAARQGRIKATIDYGDVDDIALLLKDIAFNRGHGAVLARGIKYAARKWDMEDQAIHVKGLEPPGYDPRTLKGMGLAYGSSARGACHLRSTFYKPELSNIIHRDQIDGKAALFSEWEDRLALFDTLIVCRFYRDLYQWDELSEIIRGVTGLSLDAKDMRKVASTVIDETRRFNIREGLTREDDRLPKRFVTQALPESGNLITEEQMRQLLDDYYEARGWDKDGVPPALVQG